MLIMVRYFKKYVELTLAEDQVMSPNLLQQHTSTLASFWEWSVVSVWLWIRAQVRNPCYPRSSDLSSTWLVAESLLSFNGHIWRRTWWSWNPCRGGLPCQCMFCQLRSVDRWVSKWLSMLPRGKFNWTNWIFHCHGQLGNHLFQTLGI